MKGGVPIGRLHCEFCAVGSKHSYGLYTIGSGGEMHGRPTVSVDKIHITKAAVAVVNIAVACRNYVRRFL